MERTIAEFAAAEARLKAKRGRIELKLKELVSGGSQPVTPTQGAFGNDAMPNSVKGGKATKNSTATAADIRKETAAEQAVAVAQSKAKVEAAKMTDQRVREASTAPVAPVTPVAPAAPVVPATPAAGKALPSAAGAGQSREANDAHD